MINKIYSFGCAKNAVKLPKKNENKPSYDTRLDPPLSSENKKVLDYSSILAFTGKATLMTKAKQAGNMLFTKGLNDYNNAVRKLQATQGAATQDIITEIFGLFEKASTKLDAAQGRLKLGLKEAEYAQKANVIGNIYTQMGNITGNPAYLKKAHDLFEEAANISKLNLAKAQREFQVYGANEKTLYSVLNPLPKKNPIGFRTDSVTEIAAKKAPAAETKNVIGF